MSRQGIATWRDLNSLYGTSGKPSKCPTKDEILATYKMTITPTAYYKSTQCVNFRHIGPYIPVDNRIIFEKYQDDRVLWEASMNLASDIYARISYTFNNAHSQNVDLMTFVEVILPKETNYGEIYVEVGLISLDSVYISPTSDYKFNYPITVYSLGT